FLHWIAAVEPEMEAEDYAPKFLRRGINLFRLGCLNMAKFFRRVFSTKQLPEDQRNTHAYIVRKRGMVADRSFWRVLLLSIFTLGIYWLYLMEITAENTNIACSRDGKRTWGVFPVAMLGLVTLGIFPVIWHAQQIRRYQNFCEKHGECCRVTLKYYLIWTLVGFPILVGPLIGWARFLAGYNQVCRIFNATHTFPIAKRVLEEEAAEGAAYLAAVKAAKAAAKAELVGGDTSIFGDFDENATIEEIVSAPLGAPVISETPANEGEPQAESNAPPATEEAGEAAEAAAESTPDNTAAVDPQ
ncbi:MAG: DUF4234 domain-containing protein, partial [Clostridia bacterium]|nr:DUF4234 domain-containing protein [Clostridia bacterium]